MKMRKSITGLSNRKEAAFQRRQMAIIERKFTPRIRREISRAMKQIAVADTVSARILHRENLTKILYALWSETAERFGKRTLKALDKNQKKDFVFDLPFAEQYNLAMQAWMQNNGARS